MQHIGWAHVEDLQKQDLLCKPLRASSTSNAEILCAIFCLRPHMETFKRDFIIQRTLSDTRQVQGPGIPTSPTRGFSAFTFGDSQIGWF